MRTYHYYFLEKNQLLKEAFATVTAIFFLIFWSLFLLPSVINRFNGKLMVVNAQGAPEPSGLGLIVGLWFSVVGIALFVSVIVFTYNHLILRECKASKKATWLETKIGLLEYEFERYDHYFLTKVVIFISIVIPVIYRIDLPFSLGIKALLLYFLTFLFSSLYGMRRKVLEQSLARKRKNEEKKKEKQQQKEEKENKEKSSVSAQENVQKNLQEENKLELKKQVEVAISSEEYRLPHFRKNVKAILEEINVFIHHSASIPVEDYHMIERIVSEEVPAVLLTYDELDASGREELKESLEECLTQIHAELTSRNKGKRDIKKLGAKKVIEIIKERY